MHFWVKNEDEDHGSIILESALKLIKKMKKNYIDAGYKITFTKSVFLRIWLKRGEFFGEGYMERISSSEEEETNDNTDIGYILPSVEKEEQINQIKIFKSNHCVICLNNSLNILFCNCGHICICSACHVIEELDACPVCKANNPSR